MTKKCECEVCGFDLYSEKNLKAEIKATLDKAYEDVMVDYIGRPMWVIIIGEDGAMSCSSPAFKGGNNNELLLQSLAELARSIIQKEEGDFT